MKKIDYYMSLPYKLDIIPDKDEGGYAAYYPDLPGCITTGSDIQDLIENAIDAKRTWLECAIEDGIEIKEPSSIDDSSGQLKLQLPESLYKSLMERSKKEGVSMEEYCLYLLSKNDALEGIISEAKKRQASD